MALDLSASASASASFGADGFSASASASASFGLGSNTPSGSAGGTAKPQEIAENLLPPLHVFKFEVRFTKDKSPVAVCSGAFAECTGLEATMETKAIKQGGQNYGATQRAGTVSFATVVLKRGMTATRDLWKWFDLVSTGAYSYRLDAEIDIKDTQGNTVITWALDKCLPVKFKSADLNAKSTDLGVEELHLAHEGLRLVKG